MNKVSGSGQNVAPLQNLGTAETERTNQGEKKDGILSKGIGVLKKVWLHLTGKASDVHSQQISSLRQHVSVKFGEQGLAHLNARIDNKGWDADTSSKLMSKSELSSELHRVETRLEIDARASQFAQMPFSEQLNVPVLHDAIMLLSGRTYDNEIPEFLVAINDLGATAGNVEDQAIIALKDTFIAPGSPKELNNNLLEAQSDRSSLGQVAQRIETWANSAPGAARDAEKQAILDLIHTDMRGGAEIDLGNAMGKHSDGMKIAYQQVAENSLNADIVRARLEESGLPSF